MDPLELKLEKFTGPLKILLKLIEKRKLLINEISLIEVTDDFLEKASEFEFNKEIYAEFISIAGTLIYLKSKSLLPLNQQDKSESDSEELQKRLKALQILRRQSSYLRTTYLKKPMVHESLIFKIKKRIKFAPDKNFNLNSVDRYAQNILNNLPLFPEKKQNLRRRKLRSLEEVIVELKNRLKKYAKIEISANSAEKKEDLILNFLAALELGRKGVLGLRQKDNAVELVLRKMDTPHYE